MHTLISMVHRRELTQRECGALLGYGKSNKRVSAQLNKYKACLKEGIAYEYGGVGGKKPLWDDKAYAEFAVELDLRHKARNCVPHEEIPAIWRKITNDVYKRRGMRKRVGPDERPKSSWLDSVYTDLDVKTKKAQRDCSDRTEALLQMRNCLSNYISIETLRAKAEELDGVPFCPLLTFNTDANTTIHNYTGDKVLVRSQNAKSKLSEDEKFKMLCSSIMKRNGDAIREKSTDDGKSVPVSTQYDSGLQYAVKWQLLTAANGDTIAMQACVSEDTMQDNEVRVSLIHDYVPGIDLEIVCTKTRNGNTASHNLWNDRCFTAISKRRDRLQEDGYLDGYSKRCIHTLDGESGCIADLEGRTDEELNALLIWVHKFPSVTTSVNQPNDLMRGFANNKWSCSQLQHLRDEYYAPLRKVWKNKHAPKLFVNASKDKINQIGELLSAVASRWETAMGRSVVRRGFDLAGLGMLQHELKIEHFRRGFTFDYSDEDVQKWADSAKRSLIDHNFFHSQVLESAWDTIGVPLSDKEQADRDKGRKIRDERPINQRRAVIFGLKGNKELRKKEQEENTKRLVEEEEKAKSLLEKERQEAKKSEAAKKAKAQKDLYEIQEDLRYQEALRSAYERDFKMEQSDDWVCDVCHIQWFHHIGRHNLNLHDDGWRQCNKDGQKCTIAWCPKHVDHQERHYLDAHANKKNVAEKVKSSLKRAAEKSIESLKKKIKVRATIERDGPKICVLSIYMF